MPHADTERVVHKETIGFLQVFNNEDLELTEARARGWYLARECTVHVCNSRDMFVDYKLLIGYVGVVGFGTHYNSCHFPQRQNRGIPGDLSLGIRFPGDLSPGIGRAEKLEGDTFPGDLPGRHRGAHTVLVKQIFATVEGFPGRHVARDT
ncbi:hypothetical protein Tco_1070423 [Tanacetum coccineum]|uniref:Uncharacterized protein n=1 Tax=Tanacetum coccineum TaxID=301880 RepID=A0ABQ5HMR3_9ASTR